MNNWNDLSLKEKAAMMQVAVGNGIYNLSDIKKAYNEFAEGGPEEDNPPLRNYTSQQDNTYVDKVPITEDRIAADNILSAIAAEQARINSLPNPEPVRGLETVSPEFDILSLGIGSSKSIFPTISKLLTKNPIPSFEYKNIIKSQFYKDLVKEYGDETADALAKQISTPEFRDYFVGISPKNVVKANAKHSKQMDIIKEVENAGGILSGSGQLAKHGTVHRTGLLHDLDFNIPGSIEMRTSPTLDQLGYLPAPRVSRRFPFIGRKVMGSSDKGYLNLPHIRKGQYLDMFIKPEVPTNDNITDIILNAKRQFGRPKDIADIKAFKPYSAENPMIDATTGIGQWNPTLFESLLTKDRYPLVQMVETYPESGTFIPSVMNAEGQIRALQGFKSLGGPLVQLANRYKDGGNKNNPSSEQILDSLKGTPEDPIKAANWDSDDESSRRFLINNHLRFNEDAPEIEDYFLNYVDSEGYQRILNNQYNWWKSRHPYKKLIYTRADVTPGGNWLTTGLEDAVKNMTRDGKWGSLPIYALDGYTSMSFHNPARGTFIFKGNDDSGFTNIFTLGHEYAHRFKGFTGSPSQLEVLQQNTNTEEGHDSHWEEKHADMWGLRYLLFKEGIYDSKSDKDITPEQIEQLRKLYPKLRPLEQMDNDKAAWMLNHVAYEPTEQQDPLNITALGGPLIVSANEYSKGGRIYIKPSHRGKFTRLKERTGHSASWFKLHGTPAQKKMATFALNARKWKHGEGGPLIEAANIYEEGGPYKPGTIYGRPTEEGLKIVSPEFDALMLGRLAGNAAKETASKLLNNGIVEAPTDEVLDTAVKRAIFTGQEFKKNVTDKVKDIGDWIGYMRTNIRNKDYKNALFDAATAARRAVNTGAYVLGTPGRFVNNMIPEAYRPFYREWYADVKPTFPIVFTGSDHSE